MKKYFTEFIGTFILIFCGTGACVVNEIHGGTITHVGIAITWGLVVMSIIYALGEKSGAHINPAITIAFAVNKNFPEKEIAPYIISQLAGALAASMILKLLFPASVYLGATLPAGSELQSFILEFILTFILMLVVINVAKGSKEQGLFAGIAIGSVVLFEAMFAGPVSGASMNPARSLAPAIVSGNLQHIWIYVTAPVLGAVASIFINKIIK